MRMHTSQAHTYAHASNSGPTHTTRSSPARVTPLPPVYQLTCICAFATRFDSYERVQRVPKSLLVNQAIELCGQFGRRALLVADVVDTSFSPSTPSVVSGPTMGWVLDFDIVEQHVKDI